MTEFLDRCNICDCDVRRDSSLDAEVETLCPACFTSIQDVAFDWYLIDMARAEQKEKDMTQYKQLSVKDWELILSDRLLEDPVKVPRSVRNLWVKIEGGHKLSTTEQNCLEAYDNLTDMV